jgi:hypothetical protein
MSRGNSNRQGFTLVELPVVIDLGNKVNTSDPNSKRRCVDKAF